MISKKQLINAAKEFNSVGINPPIDINVSVEELTRVIQVEVLGIGSEEPPLIGPDDQFSPETMALIDEFTQDGVAKEETATEPEEEEKEELDVPPTLLEEIEIAETLKELKAIATTDKTFKSIRGKLSGYKTADALREAMLDLLKEEEKEVKVSVEKLHEKNIASKPPRTVVENETKETTPKTAPAKKETAPKSTEKQESNEELALRLLKEGADAETIQATFATVYGKKGKNITKDFLAKRVKIYMDIARRKAEAK